MHYLEVFSGCTFGRAMCGLQELRKGRELVEEMEIKL